MPPGTGMTGARKSLEAPPFITTVCPGRENSLTGIPTGTPKAKLIGLPILTKLDELRCLTAYSFN